MWRWTDASETLATDDAGTFAPAGHAILDGVEVAAYVAPPAPPISVTPWQAREALRRAGKLEAVETAIEALGVTHAAHNAWHYAERIRRDSPLIAALQGPLKLSDADLDGLFEVAKGLTL